MLAIRRTLAQGRAAGLVSGLGAATADAVYGCIAGFGLTFISDLLVGQQTWLRLIGGLFLCYLGLKTLLAKPVEEAAQAPSDGLQIAYASMFFLTLTNPMTIISFAAIFAGLGLAGARGSYLSTGVGLSRGKFNASGLQWVNRISGAVIVGFGGLLALTSLR